MKTLLSNSLLALIVFCAFGQSAPKGNTLAIIYPPGFATTNGTAVVRPPRHQRTNIVAQIELVIWTNKFTGTFTAIDGKTFQAEESRIWTNVESHVIYKGHRHDIIFESIPGETIELRKIENPSPPPTNPPFPPLPPGFPK